MAMVSMMEAQPFTDSMPLAKDARALRERAAEDGYLYLKGLLDPGKVLRLRSEVLDLCAKHGWLDEGKPPESGLARPGMQVIESGDERFQAFYRDVLRLRAFHALALSEPLLAVLERLFGEPALPHSRNICRIMFPNMEAYTTPPHQDHLYIRGTRETFTCWIPLGDCPAELGGLAMVRGSHKGAFLEAFAGQGAGGHQVKVDDDAPWVTSPMACGDVLLLHSLCIHQARENVTGDRLRVSVDYRYQPRSHPVHFSSLQPHQSAHGMTWDDVYADWPDDDPLKYYWRDWDLNVVED